MMEEESVIYLKEEGIEIFKARYEAIVGYTKALAVDPLNSTLYRERAAGFVRFILADIDSSIEANHLESEKSKLFYMKGCMLEGIDEYEDALCAFESARSGNPNNRSISRKITWIRNERELFGSEMVAKPLQIELPRLYFLWDIESLAILRKYNMNLVIPSIVNWISSLGYEGVLEIEAVVAEFTQDRVPFNVMKFLQARGVRFIAAGKPGPGVADDLITKRINAWASKCQRGLVTVFSSDGGYHTVFERIQSPNIHTRLVYLPSSLKSGLEKYTSVAGTHTWNAVFCAGAKPEFVPRVAGLSVSPRVNSIIWAGSKTEGETDWSVGSGGDTCHWPALTGLGGGVRHAYVVKRQGGRGGQRGRRGGQMPVRLVYVKKGERGSGSGEQGGGRGGGQPGPVLP